MQCADQQVRRLGSMRAGEASSASATFDGTLVITAPSGKQMGVRTGHFRYRLRHRRGERADGDEAH